MLLHRVGDSIFEDKKSYFIGLFSPVNPNQLVSAELDAVYVVDIRKPKRLVYTELHSTHV